MFVKLKGTKKHEEIFLAVDGIAMIKSSSRVGARVGGGSIIVMKDSHLVNVLKSPGQVVESCLQGLASFAKDLAKKVDDGTC